LFKKLNAEEKALHQLLLSAKVDAMEASIAFPVASFVARMD
jgi:hypothetical protein